MISLKIELSKGEEVVFRIIICIFMPVLIRVFLKAVKRDENHWQRD